MVSTLSNTKTYFLVNKGSFRVRFSRENQFEKISKDVARKAEDFILKNSKLKLDRLSPTNDSFICSKGCEPVYFTKTEWGSVGR